MLYYYYFKAILQFANKYLIFRVHICIVVKHGIFSIKINVSNSIYLLVNFILMHQSRVFKTKE